MSSPRDDVKSRIDAIEESYEFFLAFAAQGLTSDQGSKTGGQLRSFLGKCEGAVDGLAEALRGLVAEESLEPASTWGEVLDIVRHAVGRPAGGGPGVHKLAAHR